MEKVDVIILANNVNNHYYNLTKQTIDTLLKTNYKFKTNITDFKCENADPSTNMSKWTIRFSQTLSK